MINKKIMVLLLSIVAISSIGACSAILQPIAIDLDGSYTVGTIGTIIVVPYGIPDPGDYSIYTVTYPSGDKEISHNVLFEPGVGIFASASSWNFCPNENGTASLNVKSFSADGTEYASVDTTLTIDPIDD
jgi:hypothetical protein